MESIKIFIDTDTEITFILEKILDARTECVALIIPDRAAVLSSIVGLELIKRVVDKSKKLVILVTFDELGADLARKAGFIVVSRVGEITEKIWEDALRDKFEFKKKSSQSHYMPTVLEEVEDTKTLVEHVSEPIGEDVQVVSDPVINFSNETLESKEEINGKSEIMPTDQAKKNDVPLIQIVVEERNEDEEAEDPTKEESESAVLIPKASRPVDRRMPPQVDLPGKRIRKVAPKTSGISNLSFSFGRDIREKKN